MVASGSVAVSLRITSVRCAQAVDQVDGALELFDALVAHHEVCRRTLMELPEGISINLFFCKMCFQAVKIPHFFQLC